MPSYHSDIERWLSATLDVPVTIGAVTTEWNWLRPVLTLNEIKINPTALGSAPKLGRVTIQLHMLASVLSFEPMLGHFDFSGLEIGIEKVGDRFRIVGLPLETKGKVANEEIVTAQMWKVIDTLLDQKSVQVADFQLDYYSDGEHLALQGENLLLSKQPDRYSLSTEIWFLKEQQLGVSVIASFDSDANSLAEINGELFVEFEQGDLGEWLPQVKYGDLRLDHFETIAQSWSKIESGKLESILAEIAVRDVTFINEANDESITIEEVSGQFALGKRGGKETGQRLSIPLSHSGGGLRNGGGIAELGNKQNGDESGKKVSAPVDWELNIQNLQITESGETFESTDSRIVFAPHREELQLWIDQLPLQPFAKLLNLAGAENSDQNIELTGSVRGVNLYRKGAELTIDGNLKELGLSILNTSKAKEEQTVFAISGINGGIHLDKERGAVNLAGKNMVLILPSLYDWPLSVSELNGPLVWQNSDQEFRLSSGELSVRNEDAHGKAMFTFVNPKSGSMTGKTERRLSLVASLNEGDGAQTSKYLPNSLETKLHEWLIDGDIKGDLLQGDFLFHGPLKYSRSKPQTRTFQMRFFVDKGQLTYHKDWPRLTDLNTEILINNGAVWASVYEGKIVNAELEKSWVHFPRTPELEPSAIRVRAAAVGDVADGLNVLFNSPVKSKLPEVLLKTTGSGDMQLSVDLDLPMGPSRERMAKLAENGLIPKPIPFPTTLNIEADLKRSQFDLETLNLPLTRVNGKLVYESSNGLKGTGLSAKVLGNVVKFHIQSEHSPKENRADKSNRSGVPSMPEWQSTIIYLSGMLSVEKLREWQNLNLLSFAGGEAPFNAELRFGYGDDPTMGQHRLELHTNLEGVEVSLPEPFYKPKDEPLHLFYRMSLTKPKPYISFQLADRLAAALEFHETDKSGKKSRGLERAKIHFGGELVRLPTKPGVLINGRLEKIVVEEWIDFLDSNRSVALADSESFLEKLRWMDLNLGSLDVFGTVFNDFSGQLLWIDDHWSFAFQNRDIAALTKFPNPILERLFQGVLKGPLTTNPWIDMEVPLTAEIQYLHLPIESSRQGEESDPINPNILPPLNLNIKRLYIDKDDWGTWKVWSKPATRGVDINRLSGRLREVDLDLSGKWEMAVDELPTETESQSDDYDDDDDSRGVSQPASPRYYSRMMGKLEATNVAEVMSAWDYTPSMTSKRGSLGVDLVWDGAPWSFSLNSMKGDLMLEIEDGELLDVDTAASTVRVIGLFNVHTLQRRMQLDFSDLFNRGLAYDRVKGDFSAEGGVLVTPKLEIEGPSAQFEMSGTTNLNNKQIDHTLKITLPVSRNLVLPAAAAGGLPLAATAYLVERALGDQLDKLTTFKMKATGDWEDPKLAPVSSNSQSTSDEDDL